MCHKNSKLCTSNRKMSLGPYAKFRYFQFKFAVLQGVLFNKQKNVKADQMCIVCVL